MIKKYFNQHKNATKTPIFSKNSSFIKGISYDKLEGTLYVYIGNKNYDYQISIDLADEFSRSASWGTFYDEKIKNKISPKQKVNNENIGLKKEIIPKEKQSKLEELIPDTIEEWVGITELALMAVPMSLPLRIGSVLAEIGVESYLTYKEREKPKEYDFAMYFATGYSLLSTLRMPVKSIYTIFKSPFGSISYLNSEGSLVARITKSQASATILSGGKLLKNVMTKELAVSSTKISDIIAEATSKGFVRTKAPISTINLSMLPKETKSAIKMNWISNDIRTFRQAAIEETITTGVSAAVGWGMANRESIEMKMSTKDFKEKASTAFKTALGAGVVYGTYKAGKKIMKQPKVKMAIGKTLVSIAKTIRP